MKIKNLLIILMVSMAMYGCGGGWTADEMSSCVSEGSADFGADIAGCVCDKLEGMYPAYGDVEAMFSSATPNAEEMLKVMTIFIECGAQIPQ